MLSVLNRSAKRAGNQKVRHVKAFNSQVETLAITLEKTDTLLAASAQKNASEVARRYAGALFDLGAEKNQLKAIADDLSTLEGLFETSEDLVRLVNNPAFSRDDKVKTLTAIVDSAGIKSPVAGFVGTMAQNGRANEITCAIAVFDTLYADHRGVKRAIARTAHDMSAEQRKKLEAVVAKAMGSDVELVTEVDPALVGGLQLQIGSKLIDASIATKLDRMNTAMKGA